MKVFLWCWLCYFQQKDGARHTVYVFTWHGDSCHLSRLESTGICLVDKQQEPVQDANCVLYWLLQNWLQCFSSNLIYSFQLQENSFQHQHVWDWTELVCDIWVVVFFLMLSLSFFTSLFLWNTDTTPRLFGTPQHLLPLTSLKAELPVWKLLCVCACVCVRVCVHVSLVLLSHLLEISALVCRALVYQSCACPCACLRSSTVLFHSRLQKVTPTR